MACSLLTFLNAYHAPILAAAEQAASGETAQESEAAEQTELAKKLQNPVANLISVPIQNNWDFGIGPANAMRPDWGLRFTVTFLFPKH